MVTIIKTEFMKLKRYFIVWIGVSLMLLTVLLTLFTTMADDGMVWDYQFLFEQVVKHFVTMIFPMCITLISGYMISREYTDDTLKNIETLPISFRKLLAGKLIVSAILSLFLGIVCFVFTVMDKLCIVDHYPSDRFTFSSHGYDLHIENELVADAFAGLSVQEQSILILHFVLDLPDQEVGRLVGMSRSAVQRRRAKSLTELRIKLAALMPKGG